MCLAFDKIIGKNSERRQLYNLVIYALLENLERKKNQDNENRKTVKGKFL